MRRRLPVAAASAVLAASLLTSCHSNVGAAATVNGHKISESDVAKYLTPTAQAIPEQDANGNSSSVPARSFILTTLIDARIFDQAIGRLRADAQPPRTPPTASEITAAEAAFLNGATVQQLTDGVARSGLKRSFATVYLRERAMETILGNEANAGADINALLAKLHLKVSVNPRYGTWDTKTFALAAQPKDGLPPFLDSNATYAPPAPATSSAPPA